MIIIRRKLKPSQNIALDLRNLMDIKIALNLFVRSIEICLTDKFSAISISVRLCRLDLKHRLDISIGTLFVCMSPYAYYYGILSSRLNGDRPVVITAANACAT